MASGRPSPSARADAPAPHRLAPLDRLPVFLALRGRRAVVAGGTAAAAWKAELLAAAGATVDVLAEVAEDEMRALLHRGAAAGALRLVERRWRPGDLAGAALAVCDAHSEEDAVNFACAAARAGVPANVIDRPQHCTVQFGTIVNRSPVVIGISTSGGAPILGQAIRRRIEALLPPALADWGRLALDVRARAGAMLAPGRRRRAFWETLCERAFRGAAPPAVDDLLSDARTGAAGGLVSLVGAGPGGAGFLTLDAVRALQCADIVVFDEGIGADILELARREARRIVVPRRAGGAVAARAAGGRAGGTGATARLLAALAREGHHVVRLCAGDAGPRSRGGRDIAVACAAGMEVRVIPGLAGRRAVCGRSIAPTPATAPRLGPQGLAAAGATR